MKALVVKNTPGLVTAFLLALFSVFLSSFGSFLGAATIALILGMLIGNTCLRSDRIEVGLGYAEKNILKAAIVLIGFGMNAKIFSVLGTNTWFFVGVSVVLVLLVALIVGRWFRLSSQMGALIGAGSAICGSAAIGAVSPLLHSKEEETGLSIGVINLLSTLGLLLLPILGGVLDLSTENSGLFIGGILQSMGHVVGAGFSMGGEVGTAATVVKMGRILLIIPLLLVLFFMNRKKKVEGEKMRFPVFIPLFIVALLLAQMSFFPVGWSSKLAEAGDFMLIAAMVAIGYKIRLKPLFKIAGPALAAGFVVFGFQIVLYLLYLYL